MILPRKTKLTSSFRLKVNDNPILRQYRSCLPPVPSGVPVMQNLGGSFRASTVVLLGHPSEDEMTNQWPFSSPDNRFVGSVFSGLGFNLSKDFLFVHCSVFGEKPSKHSSLWARPFVQWLSYNAPRVRRFLCVGMDPFSYVFSEGRKTHAKTIVGNPMFIPDINVRSVYVLPDATGFSADPEALPFRAKREMEDRITSFTAYVMRFQEFCKTDF